MNRPEDEIEVVPFRGGAFRGIFNAALLEALIALLIFLCVRACRAEDLPQAPSPTATAKYSPILRSIGMVPVKEPHRFIDYSEWSAVVLLRALDWTSTEQGLRRPYAQFHEVELPNRLVHDKPVFAVFEGIMAGASIEGQRFLEKRGHRKLAQTLQLADVASMTWTVNHNYKLAGPTPKGGK